MPRCATSLALTNHEFAVHIHPASAQSPPSPSGGPMRRLVAMLAVLLLPALPGCGLIFGGTHQNIAVQSSPEAVKVTTTPATSEFTTPATLNLERKNDYSLTFEKAGYTPAHFQITHHMRGGILFLDILVGLVGNVADAAPPTAHAGKGRTSATLTS